MMSLPMLKPLDSTSNKRINNNLLDNDSADQPPPVSTRVSAANAVIVSRRKKKSHLSRDELARVCNEGEVAFEPYNGSTYMVAVRSLGDRKSLIGYRCDWHSCGYMNARVERMFGHIRSQHPEAPAIKKLISTTATNTSVTTTTTLSASSSITETNTTTTAASTGATIASARLSIRSSSSLSSSSSSPSSNSSMLAFSPNDNHHSQQQHQQHQSTIIDCQTPGESCPPSPLILEDSMPLPTSAGAESILQPQQQQQQQHMLTPTAQAASLVGDTTTTSSYLEPNDLAKVSGKNRLIDLLKCKKPTPSVVSQQQQQQPSTISTTAEQIMSELKTITSPSSSSTQANNTTTSTTPLLAGSTNHYGPIDRNNNLHQRGGGGGGGGTTAQHANTTSSAVTSAVTASHDDDLLDLESLLTSSTTNMVSTDNTNNTPTADTFVSQAQSYAPPPNALGHFDNRKQPPPPLPSTNNNNCYALAEPVATPGGTYSQQHYGSEPQFGDYVGDCDVATPASATSVSANSYSYHSGEPPIILERRDNNNKQQQQHQPPMSQAMLAAESEVQPARKKSTTSKNYIGKQNLFQEFLNQEVAKIRDSENKYIIALQKDTKIVGYRCDWPECEFLTCRKYVMVNHINGKHTNQRPFPCPMCSFSFVKRYFLKAHLHKVHKQDIGDEKDDLDEIEAIKRSNRMNLESGCLENEERNFHNHHHHHHHHQPINKRVKREHGPGRQAAVRCNMQAARLSGAVSGQHGPPMTGDYYDQEQYIASTNGYNTGTVQANNNPRYQFEANAYGNNTANFAYNNSVGNNGNNAATTFYDPLEGANGVYNPKLGGYNGKGVGMTSSPSTMPSSFAGAANNGPTPTATATGKQYGGGGYEGQYAGDAYHNSPGYNSTLQPQSWNSYSNYGKATMPTTINSNRSNNSTSPQSSSNQSFDMLTPPHSASLRNPLALSTATTVGGSGGGQIVEAYGSNEPLLEVQPGHHPGGYLPLNTTTTPINTTTSDEFLSPPSSISSNGSSIAGLSSGCNTSGSDYCHPGNNLATANDSPCGGAGGGANVVMGRTTRSSLSNSLATASSFYLHTPSPSPSSVTNSPAGGHPSSSALSINREQAAAAAAVAAGHINSNNSYSNFDVNNGNTSSNDYQWQSSSSAAGNYYGQTKPYAPAAAALAPGPCNDFGVAGNAINNTPGEAYYGDAGAVANYDYAGNADRGNGYDAYGSTGGDVSFGDWTAASAGGW